MSTRSDDPQAKCEKASTDTTNIQKREADLAALCPPKNKQSKNNSNAKPRTDDAPKNARRQIDNNDHDDDKGIIGYL